MKNLLKYLLLLTLLPILSCEDLDEEVFSEFTTENFYQDAAQLQTQGLSLYSFRPHSSVIEEWAFQMMTCPNKYFASRDQTYGRFAGYDISPDNAYNNDLWRIFFGIIGRANTIIKYAPESPVNQTLVTHSIAEARFFRAFVYFHITRLWGEVPLHDEPIETLDESVLLKSNAPLEDIYAQIIDDLNFAKENLPALEWADSPPGRVLAGAAHQLLGLVYLTMAGEPLNDPNGYQNAIDAIEFLVQNRADYGLELLTDWKENFSVDNKINSEKLFSLYSAPQDTYGSAIPFYSTPLFSIGYNNPFGFGVYCLSYDFYNLFEINDVRRQDGFIYTYTDAFGETVTYEPGNENATNFYGGDNGLCSTKYTDATYAAGVISHTNNIWYMRFVESYLILAEAYMEINNLPKARENLNIVRSRVNASTIDSGTQEQLRQIIREERWRELHFEMTELYDIRRWGEVQSNFEEHPLVSKWYPQLSWDEKFLLYPIPSNETSRNTNIKQNSGW